MKYSISSIVTDHLGGAISRKSQVAYILMNGGYRLVVLIGGYSIAFMFSAEQYNYYSKLFWIAGLYSVVTSWSASNGFIHELRNDRLGLDTYLASVVVTLVASLPLALITVLLTQDHAAHAWILAYSVLLGTIQNFVYFNLYSGNERVATLFVLALVLIAVSGYSLTCFLRSDAGMFFKIQTIFFLPLLIIIATRSSRRVPPVMLNQVWSLMRVGGIYVPTAAIVSTLFVIFQYEINQKLSIDYVRLINLGLPIIGLIGFAISNVISVNVGKLLAAHQDVSTRVSRVALILLGLTFASYAFSYSLGLIELAIFGALIVAGIANGASFLLPIVAAASGKHRAILYVSAASFLVSGIGIHASPDVPNLLFFFALFFTGRLSILCRVSR